MRTLIELTCDGCGIKFDRQPSVIVHMKRCGLKGNYCSRSCSARNNRTTKRSGVRTEQYENWLVSVYTKHWRGLVLTAHQILQNIDAAKDAVQETMYRFLKNIHEYESEQILRRTLYVSVKNMSLEMYNGKTPFTQLLEKEEETIMDEDWNLRDKKDKIMAQLEITAILNQEIDKFHPLRRQILHLTAKGWEPKQIAVELNRSPKIVNNAKWEAIQSLKKRINKIAQLPELLQEAKLY